MDIPAALSTILATPDTEMLITLTHNFDPSCPITGLSLRLTSHLFALFSGEEEAVWVSTVTPPVPATIGVDRVDQAVSDLGISGC